MYFNLQHSTINTNKTGQQKHSRRLDNRHQDMKFKDIYIGKSLIGHNVLVSLSSTPTCQVKLIRLPPINGHWLRNVCVFPYLSTIYCIMFSV